jgi:hypothetical protein
MKRILFASAMIALVLPLLPQAQAADVSVEFFYNNLSGGSWVEVGDYGYCWQPEVAVNDPSWRPYADGYWAYTDVGWTWISYEDFGWATYHYGRWAKLADYGWVWVPGADLEWGPAWVSWRTGGDYIGWAPLPPRGPEFVYEGRPIDARVDIEFDIGPAYYNFCDIRYIGEPVLRQRIVDVRQNVTYINQTVNVTNITYNNKTVYNYGPDINVVNQRSSRPIQRLRLERQENVDVTTAAKSGGITKVQGSSLVVAAPMRINKPAQPVAPPAVKTKVTQAKIERGWSGVDPNAQAQIKEKIRTEDHNKIPPPTGASATGTSQATAGGSPGAPASPAATAAIVGSKEKGRNKPGEQFQENVTGPGARSPTAATSPATAPESGKPGRGRHPGQAVTTPPTTGATTVPEGQALPEGRRRGQPERSNIGPTPRAPSGAAENVNEAPGRHRQFEQGATPPVPVEGQGKHRRLEESPTPPRGVQGAQGQAGPPPEGRGERQRVQGPNEPPSGATPRGGTGAGTGEGKHEGQKRGEKGSPSPGPQ